MQLLAPRILFHTSKRVRPYAWTSCAYLELSMLTCTCQNLSALLLIFWLAVGLFQNGRCGGQLRLWHIAV